MCMYICIYIFCNSCKNLRNKRLVATSATDRVNACKEFACGRWHAENVFTDILFYSTQYVYTVCVVASVEIKTKKCWSTAVLIAFWVTWELADGRKIHNRYFCSLINLHTRAIWTYTYICMCVSGIKTCRSEQYSNCGRQCRFYSGVEKYVNYFSDIF